MKHNEKNTIETIALARIERIFELAKKEFDTNPRYSHAWVRLALRIGTRNRVRIPEEFKHSYCKKCHSFLAEGKNKHTKSENGFAEIHCQKCGHRFKRKKQVIEIR